MKNSLIMRANPPKEAVTQVLKEIQNKKIQTHLIMILKLIAVCSIQNLEKNVSESADPLEIKKYKRKLFRGGNAIQ